MKLRCLLLLDFRGRSASHVRSIETPRRVVGVPFVDELDEGMSGRGLTGQPDVLDLAEPAEHVLDFTLLGTRTEVADVHFGGCVPFSEFAHCSLVLKDCRL